MTARQDCEVDALFDAAIQKRARRVGGKVIDSVGESTTADKKKYDAAATRTKSPKTKAPAEHAPTDDIADVRGDKKAARALTDDGLPIYSWQEMRIGQGGDTPECPFDCSCCF